MLDLVLEKDLPRMDGMPSIGAGLPPEPGRPGSVLATGVQFAVVPHHNTARPGPFVNSSMLDDVRNDVVVRGLLGPLPGMGNSSWWRANLNSKRITTLVHTDFYPNRDVADCVAGHFQSSTGDELTVDEAPYVEPYAGYGQFANSGDLLPIVPSNTSAAVIARNLLAVAKHFLSRDDVKDIERCIRVSEAADAVHISVDLATSAADRIAEITGYSTIGNYLGRFWVDAPGAHLVSSTGYIDIEGMYK